MPIKAEKMMDILVSLCKRRGFIFPGSEIYGGFAHSWDYGPYGVELKNNLRNAWWHRFVRDRDDVAGVDTPIIMNPKVWEASGHVKTFADPLVDCKKCKKRFRADQLESNVCSECGGELTSARQFNLMFKTYVGVTEDASALAYLRPETAGGMFVAWKNVRDSMRKRLPFGIAQIGKAFRNEITPGNFIFRTREFEQMEIEYFVAPEQADAAFEMWLKEMKAWIREVLKLNDKNVVYREVPKEERAHYSTRTIDIDYQFPFGQDELYGLANRADYDLSRHQEASGQDLRWLDPESGKKILPYVIEPTWGLDRSVLAVLVEHLDLDEAPTAEKGEKEERFVLRFPPHLAPVKAAVLPLLKKEKLANLAKGLTQKIRQQGIAVEYDDSASIGKRYRRQDEIGTPWCFTVDHESLDDKKVTVRDRDTMTQERISIDDVSFWISQRLQC